MSGAHAHWVGHSKVIPQVCGMILGSLDTPSHATKGKKCATGTGLLITLLIDFQR